MHLFNPVAQRIHYQRQNIAVLNVKRCAAAGAVVIITLVVGIQRVIRRIVNAAIAEGRSQLVTLAGVIINNVKNNFDTLGMERFDHLFEFVNFIIGEIGLFRRKERKAFIPPVIILDIPFL